MFAISLTSIPPRFQQLPRVFAALRAQTRPPDRIFLTIPKSYRRFPDTPNLPNLEGVTILRPDYDPGPASKALFAAMELNTSDDLIYCDDDWNYAPTWADALFAARPDASSVVAAAPFEISRLKRQGGAVAQGFAGVLIKPTMIPIEAHSVPDAAWAVDDIWLSGHYAWLGHNVVPAPAAREGCYPISDTGNLQDSGFDNKSRAEANLACATLVYERYGVWPPMAGS